MTGHSLLPFIDVPRSVHLFRERDVRLVIVDCMACTSIVAVTSVLLVTSNCLNAWHIPDVFPFMLFIVELTRRCARPGGREIEYIVVCIAVIVCWCSSYGTSGL